MNIFLLALQEVPGGEEINFGMLLLRMLLFLAIVIALIWVILRKFLPLLAQGPAMRGRTLKVVERLPLDQKRSILVVEVQDRVFLVGSAEGQVNVLMELDADKYKAAQSAPASPNSFEGVLKKVFSKQGASQTPKN